MKYKNWLYYFAVQTWIAHARGDQAQQAEYAKKFARYRDIISAPPELDKAIINFFTSLESLKNQAAVPGSPKPDGEGGPKPPPIVGVAEPQVSRGTAYGKLSRSDDKKQHTVSGATVGGQDVVTTRPHTLVAIDGIGESEVTTDVELASVANETADGLENLTLDGKTQAEAIALARGVMEGVVAHALGNNKRSSTVTALRLYKDEHGQQIALVVHVGDGFVGQVIGEQVQELFPGQMPPNTQAVVNSPAYQQLLAERENPTTTGIRLQVIEIQLDNHKTQFEDDYKRLSPQEKLAISSLETIFQISF